MLDWLNAALMIGCCALAYRFPVELLVFSTAVLGPAHYLTQLSWLEDRDYFAADRRYGLALAALACGAIVSPAFLWAAFALAACAAWRSINGTNWIWAAGAVLLGFFAGPKLGFFATTMLPTAAHVFLFTALFIAAGAVKRRSAAGFFSLAVLLACGASFFVLRRFDGYPLSPALHHRFERWLDADGAILARFGLSGYERTIGVAGFLGFAYTYHYLNWFSKVELIGWRRVPPRRWPWLAAVYAGLLALLWWDFDAGVAAGAVLSMAHVVLELPLDFRTAAGLFRAAPEGV